MTPKMISPTRVLLSIAAGSPPQTYCTFPENIRSVRSLASKLYKNGVGIWRVSSRNDIMKVTRII